MRLDDRRIYRFPGALVDLRELAFLLQRLRQPRPHSLDGEGPGALLYTGSRRPHTTVGVCPGPCTF